MEGYIILWCHLKQERPVTAYSWLMDNHVKFRCLTLAISSTSLHWNNSKSWEYHLKNQSPQVLSCSFLNSTSHGKVSNWFSWWSRLNGSFWSCFLPLSFCHTLGTRMQKPLPSCMKVCKRTQQQCTISQATQIKVTGETRKSEKAVQY